MHIESLSPNTWFLGHSGLYIMESSIHHGFFGLPGIEKPKGRWGGGNPPQADSGKMNALLPSGPKRPSKG